MSYLSGILKFKIL